MWPRRKRKKQNGQAEGPPNKTGTAQTETANTETAETGTAGAQAAEGPAKQEKPAKRRYGWVPSPAKPASETDAKQTAREAEPASKPPAAERAPDQPAARQPEPEAEAASEPQPAAVPEQPAKSRQAGDTGGQTRKSWVARLRDGLWRSSSKLGDGIGSIFTKRKLDAEALEELEDLLIASDLGVSTSAKLAGGLRKERFPKEAGPEEVRAALAEDIEEILKPVAQPLEIQPAAKPHIVLVVGVNGSGKTTTIGKLGKQYVDQGYKVQFAAGDTFRAAAVEQLQVWGERTGCPVTAKETGADAAGLAYDAVAKAQKDGANLLLIDTAGRLHNKSNLMAELQKVVRVIQKLAPDAPHDVLLVLDATTGQNALSQVETFKQLINVTGLTVTKLDGSARGGVLVPLADKYGLPVHAVGVGETADDLRPFSARAFARSLMGLDPER
ncbi:signal recognition particle-docking protein FtsY [Rhodovibrio sodomensis]|uniref:signal recognition particle-docking protein FtsY n=1 Tax=Rhodovibrio sodomensis TaxID=1088 RepID=UPI001F5B327E|nr:signal recognition particle-docking protein FtsY [Rhodovibrio sodomensis]